MAFAVNNHVLFLDGKPVAQKTTPNKGPGLIKPTLLVMHYTASQSAKGAVSWLCNPNAKASAHLVVDLDGTVTQLCKLNEKAWHAGISKWRGKTYCNGFSIGIEMANPGYLEKRADGKFYDVSGKVVPDKQVVMAAHKNGGAVRPWMAYPVAQFDACVGVAQAIVAAYGIKEIVGHEDIAPGRKTDPGPAFAMEGFVGRVFGRK